MSMSVYIPRLSRQDGVELTLLTDTFGLGTDPHEVPGLG